MRGEMGLGVGIWWVRCVLGLFFGRCGVRERWDYFLLVGWRWD